MTNIAYKLTDQDGYTRRGQTGETLWVPGEWHEAKPGDKYLCSDGWIHCYAHPLLAALHNPTHANFQAPRLWECEIDGEAKHEGLMKSGVKRLRVVRELPLPQVTTNQRVYYAIYCAMMVCNDRNWLTWADRWLSGADRTTAAYATAAYATAAAATAAYATAAAATAAYATAAAATAAYAAAAAAAAAYATAAAAAADVDLLLCALMAAEE